MVGTAARDGWARTPVSINVVTAAIISARATARRQAPSVRPAPAVSCGSKAPRLDIAPRSSSASGTGPTLSELGGSCEANREGAPIGAASAPGTGARSVASAA
ncbi:hypothetical protein GCM10009528_05510 [Kineococcus aurantiacus]